MTINYGFDEIDGTNECPDEPTEAYGRQEWEDIHGLQPAWNGVGRTTSAVGNNDACGQENSTPQSQIPSEEAR